MSLARYRFVPKAVVDLDKAARWYAKRRVGFGKRFRLAVRDALNIVREYPESGTPYVEDTRRCSLQTFPFSLVYVWEPGTNMVTIFAVADDRREPGHWLDRL